MLSLWMATAFSGAVLAFNPTPHPQVGWRWTQQTKQAWKFQVRSTWPNGIYPGENCLAYDGSKVPDCTEYIDVENYIPYYHEHSQSMKSPSQSLTIFYPISSRLQSLLGVWACWRELPCWVRCLLSSRTWFWKLHWSVQGKTGISVGTYLRW